MNCPGCGRFMDNQGFIFFCHNCGEDVWNKPNSQNKGKDEI